MKRPLLLAMSTAALSLVSAFPTAAAAARRASVPDSDLVLEIDARGELWVRQRAVKARVPVDLPYPDTLLDVHLKSASSAVTLNVEANCLGVQTLTMARVRLDALLEDAAAQSLMRAQRWDQAAAGFARALAADPSFAESATSLAAAQARGGHAADATATLASAVGRDPIWVAWRLASDPDLAGLAAAPALARLYPLPPSDLATRPLEVGHVAFSPGRGLYAWRRAQSSAMGGARVDDQLWIADVTTGAVRARLDLGRDGRHAAAVARTLDALGFTDVVAIRRLDQDEAEPRAARLPGSGGLEVTFDGGMARVWRGGHLVGAARFQKPRGADSPSWIEPWAASVPGAVIVGAGVTIGDGCGAWSYDHVLRILVPEGGDSAKSGSKRRRRPKRERREGDQDERGVVYSR